MQSSLLVDFINSTTTIDVKPKNGTFTWNARQRGKTFLMERLGRFSLNEDWLEKEFNV